MYHTCRASSRPVRVPLSCLYVLYAIHQFELKQPLLRTQRLPVDGICEVSVQQCVELGWVIVGSGGLMLTERGSEIVELEWHPAFNRGDIRKIEQPYLRSLMRD